jgi:hypothetical protein
MITGLERKGSEQNRRECEASHTQESVCALSGRMKSRPMEALMNRGLLLSAKDQAFIAKWRWRLAFCYSAILLSIVIGAAMTPRSSAEQGFSSAAIDSDHPHAR